MCRSIKTLRRRDGGASEREVEEAALQFVRKISGYRTPSRRNSQAFESAVDDIAGVSRRLLESLTVAEGSRPDRARAADEPEAARPESVRRRAVSGRH
jgi:hypothetical protein